MWRARHEMGRRDGRAGTGEENERQDQRAHGESVRRDTANESPLTTDTMSLMPKELSRDERGDYRPGERSTASSERLSSPRVGLAPTKEARGFIKTFRCEQAVCHDALQNSEEPRALLAVGGRDPHLEAPFSRPHLAELTG
jgi:hypothetical protein